MRYETQAVIVDDDEARFTFPTCNICGEDELKHHPACPNYPLQRVDELIPPTEDEGPPSQRPTTTPEVQPTNETDRGPSGDPGPRRIRLLL